MGRHHGANGVDYDDGEMDDGTNMVAVPAQRYIRTSTATIIAVRSLSSFIDPFVLSNTF